MTISIEYSDFANKFLFDFRVKLIKYTTLRNHFINLVDNK